MAQEIVLEEVYNATSEEDSIDVSTTATIEFTTDGEGEGSMYEPDTNNTKEKGLSASMPST